VPALHEAGRKVTRGEFGDGSGSLGARTPLAVIGRGGLWLLLNDGSGGFGDPEGPYETGSDPSAMAWADFNSDLRLDLVVAASGAATGVAMPRARYMTSNRERTRTAEDRGLSRHPG
jgi:hypothetical protein